MPRPVTDPATSDPEPSIREALLAVLEDFGGRFSYDGQRTGGANFNYRSADGIHDAVRPVLIANGIVPQEDFRIQSTTVVPRGNDKPIFRTVVEGSITLYGPAGDSLTYGGVGGAVDYEGRDVSQAQTDCAKNIYLKMFLAGSGNSDSEQSDYHSSAPASAPAQRQASQPARQPNSLRGAAAGAAGRGSANQHQSGGDQDEEAAKLTKWAWAACCGNNSSLHWEKDDYLGLVSEVVGQTVRSDRGLSLAQAQELLNRARALEEEAKSYAGGEPPVADEPGGYDSGGYGFDSEPF